MKTAENIKNLTGRRPAQVDNPLEIKRSIRQWERKIFPLFPESRAQRIIHMFNEFMPLSYSKIADINELFHHRNALTHEIVQVGFGSGEKFVSADAEGISLEDVDLYFDAVGDFILSTMDAFKLYRRKVVD